MENNENNLDDESSSNDSSWTPLSLKNINLTFQYSGILNMIKAKIYHSLIYYWNIPNDSGIWPYYWICDKNLDCLDKKNFIMNMNQWKVYGNSNNI